MLADSSSFWLSVLMALSELSDGRLVSRCRLGEAGAWDELIERFSRYVWATAKNAYRLSETDAEDVSQEVFARTYQHLDRLRSDGAIRPWIGQLTRRLATDRIRQSGREHATDALPESAATDGELERLAEAMDVRAAVGALPAHCREILDRFFARDESYDTIGSLLGIPPGTIASRISRCLDKLRETLVAREAVGAT